MKKLVAVCLCSQLILGCNDPLNLAPEDLIATRNFYKTERDFETALIGAYSSLQIFHNSSSLHFIGDLTTDNAEIQDPNPQAATRAFDEMEVTPTNSVVDLYWKVNYRTISQSNAILNQLRDSSIDDVRKNEIGGQARFLRAYSYFNLVRLFGGVPLIDMEFQSPEQISSFDMRRATVSDIYDFIIRDLTDAAQMLPEDVFSNKGKASIGAVKTLLGKVYLTIHEFDEAEVKLRELMEMEVYALEQNYQDLFVKGNDDKAESIWEIEYASGNVGEGNSYAEQFYPLIRNMAVFRGDLIGGGHCVPTQSLLTAYEPGDLRKEFTVGDQIPLTDGTIITSTFCRKFVDYDALVLADGGVNFTALRYADVLLMYSEALNELNRQSEAYPYLNMVRERAGLSPLTGLSKEEFRFAMEQERRVELAFEGHRWFDLLRTRRAQEVINGHFSSRNMSFVISDFELLLPIPQAERQIDFNLDQNPGY